MRSPRLVWTEEGLSAPRAVASWSLRCTATPSQWLLDGVEPVRAGKAVSDLEDRLAAGAFARAEETERWIARQRTYPAGVVVCVVDEGDFAICTSRAGSTLVVAAWLWRTREARRRALPAWFAAVEKKVPDRRFANVGYG